MITIGIFLFDGAEELDFVGPFEVFTMINEVMSFHKEPDAVKVILISETGKDIMGAKGMRVGVDAAIRDIEMLDVFCIPGGEGTRPMLENETVINWINQIAPTCQWVTSVCTGSMVLSKAGLTKGKNITTHWANFGEFEKRELEGHLQSDVRYVADGNLVTAAGVSAGIDMALWLTGQIFDSTLARHVQKAMEYDPLPPYADEA